jgi:uncharacterized paraquat-inducible protein A
MKPTDIEEIVKCQQCNTEVKLTYIDRPGFNTTYSCDCPRCGTYLKKCRGDEPPDVEMVGER